MRPKPLGKPGSARRTVLAMTLIEVIGVLAVIAILGAVLLPALVRQIDKTVADQEVATLQSFGNALPRSVMRNRYIPGATDWTNNIATELGMSVSDVAMNVRQQPRYLLIDPALQVGTNQPGLLPYPQTNWPFGSMVTAPITLQIIPPTSPRVMILSSLGQSLPTAMINGVPLNTNDFNIIWNWDDTSSTPPAAAVLSGWGGKAEDLKIQRINLSSIFLHLLLSTYPSTTTGYYSVDAANLQPFTNSLEGYFIKSSVLNLYQGASGTLDSQQLLIRDGSFVFESGVWKGSILGGSMPGGIDIADAVGEFLGATVNSNAPVKQLSVVGQMANYMNAYLSWAQEGTWVHDALWQAAVNAQSNMIYGVTNLYYNP